MIVATTAPPSRLERLFRLSSYLTLGIACGSLVWAEMDILSDIIVFAAVVAVLLVAAFVTEGRWSLSIRAANVCGLAIAVLVGIWAAGKLLNPPPDSPLATMFPTNILPLLGPLLLMLLPAKLLRPKTIADHWGLQGIGLVCIGLACALVREDDMVFPGLMLVYLVSALWTLALFFLYREHHGRAVANGVPSPRPQQLLGWAMPILGLAMVGFLTLPRTNVIWQVPRQSKKLDTGITEEPGLDLNRTGTLTLDPEVAFEVYAEDRFGNPKTDLPSDQRWRGPVYRVYLNGKWGRGQPGAGNLGGPQGGGQQRQIVTTIDDRDDRFTLWFTVKSDVGRIPCVADPIYRPEGVMPVVTLYGDRVDPWVAENDSLLAPRPTRERPGPGSRYRQVSVPPPERDLGHAVAALPERTYNMGPVTSIPAPIQQDLGKWTRAVIQDLVSAGRLPEKAIPDENAPDRFYPVDPDLWETVARGLEWYLSHSGNYTYSLNLDRADAKIDPTLDFLFNTRSGHCNRFASALALMLRSVRIPSQVVLGYRGADSKGEGRYEVRQCYAHTWVEVLVTRHDAGGNLYMHWLSLDPTPEEASDEAVAVGNRWWSTGFDFRKSYRNLIVNFTIENRDEFFNDVAAAARTLWSAGRKALMAHTPEGFRLRIAAGLFGLVLLTGLVHVTRWARRRALARRGPSPSPLTAFYRRLLVILARQGWTPGAAQTSREFADDVAQRLQQRGRAEMAAIVCHASKLFDRVRYGAAPLSEEESLRMDAELDQLARDLATSAN